MGKHICQDTCPPCCEPAIVKLDDDCLALVCLILNCIPFTSGVGTMVSACTGPAFNCQALLFGIDQFLLTGLLGGYIWSIIHGVMIY